MLKRIIFAIVLLGLAVGVIAYADATRWNIGVQPTGDWFGGSNTYRNVPLMWMRAIDPLVELGVNPGTGNVYYVDSNVTVEGDGSNWGNAKDTLDEAFALCTANNGDVILVAQGHAESLAGAADVTADLIGVTVIGLGNGDNVPTFTVATDSNEAAPVKITANNVTLCNLRFVGGKTGGSQDAIEIAANYATIDRCEFVETVNTKELAVANNYGIITILDTAAAITNVTISNCQFHLASGGNNESAIALTDASNGVTHVKVLNCFINGTFADGAIQWDQGTNPLTDAVVANSTIINDLATGGVGACISIDSGDAVIIVNCTIGSADGDKEPISDDAASYLINTWTCEAGAYGLTSVNGSATNWGS